MGEYLNPPGDKVEWLRKHGKAIPVEPEWPAPEAHLYVCLIYNLSFTSALVLVDKDEYDYMIEHPDVRPKSWFAVPTNLLLLAAVKAYANDHYDEDGWDEIVEAFDDQDILELIKDARTNEEAIKAVRKVALLRKEHGDEIRATAW